MKQIYQLIVKMTNETPEIKLMSHQLCYSCSEVHLSATHTDYQHQLMCQQTNN